MTQIQALLAFHKFWIDKRSLTDCGCEAVSYLMDQYALAIFLGEYLALPLEHCLHVEACGSKLLCWLGVG